LKNKQSPVVLSILNLLGFIGVLVANTLAIILPINGKTTQQLSDQYPNLFVPAGLTFSIWSVIYILLAIFVIYGLFSAFKGGQKAAFLNNIDLIFFLSCIANVAWIFAWHYEMVAVSMVIMLLLLACLLIIYLKQHIGRKGLTGAEKYLVNLPFSVYLGWITIATIANITALLVTLNLGSYGLSEEIWTIAIIIAGIAITMGVLFTRQDIFYSLVVDWAILGILIKRTSDAVQIQSIIITAAAGIGIISLGILFQILKKKVYSSGAVVK
jgi:hypothetical protein